MADPLYYLGPKVDIFDPVVALLETKTGIPSYFLEQSTNRRPVHYEWSPQAGTFTGAKYSGKGPRILAHVEWTVQVLCRGKTHDEAWKMAAWFASAARRVKQAGFRLDSWSVPESSSQPATQKTDVILTCTFLAPFVELPIDSEGVEPVTVTAVGFDTASPYGTDDGTLRPPTG